eukprot:396150-Pyramimonas_sp.AAC.1
MMTRRAARICTVNSSAQMAGVRGWWAARRISSSMGASIASCSSALASAHPGRAPQQAWTALERA